MKKILSVLKIYLMVASLSCAHNKLPEFPTPTVNQPLFKKEVTREFEFVKDEMKFKQNLPLESVNGEFCISAEEYNKVRNWIFQVNQDYECRIKNGNQSN